MSQGNNNVLRAPRNKNYKTIGCDFLDDKDLSYKAKGILAYLLTRPDSWNFNKDQVMAMSSEGTHAFDTGIKELKEKGYLRIKKSSDGEGKFLYEWYPQETATFNVEPFTEEQIEKIIKTKVYKDKSSDPEGDFPSTDNPVPEKPSPDNRPLYHIGSNNKEKTSSIKQRDNPEKAPSLPTMIADTIVIGHKFPYKGVRQDISAIWYWAVKRFEKHKIDFLLNADIFKKMLFKYSQTVPKIGKDFESQTAYIDWYLGLTDAFVSKETNWGFDYLCSAHCVNKYFASKSKVVAKLILTEEDRRKVKGTWLKS